MKIVASAAIGMGDIFGLGGGMIGLAVGMMVVSRIKEEETKYGRRHRRYRRDER